MVQSCSPQETKFLAKLAAKRITYGRLAQLGERLPYKQDVIGSSPIVSIFSSLMKRPKMRQRGSIGRAADL